MQRSAFAPGKIILSGEYAMVFGYPGIAVPAAIGVTATFEEHSDANGIETEWNEVANDPLWEKYLQMIVRLCDAKQNGRLVIQNDLPLGKGMGSSTALVIAVCKCLLGEDCKDKALAVEDKVNPGHSGMDFSVIWENTPITFTKETGAKPVALPNIDLSDAVLIDTGTPDQQTPELVAWVREREAELREPLEQIRSCSKQLQQTGLTPEIIKQHHRAQVALGIVPVEVQELIQTIEEAGGCAKVIGAGAKSGGAGMVLALNVSVGDIPTKFPIQTL